MRWFISVVVNLHYYGKNGLQIVDQSKNFIWDHQKHPWQGWHHVYSMNKAGKGTKHNPSVNANGYFNF